MHARSSQRDGGRDGVEAPIGRGSSGGSGSSGSAGDGGGDSETTTVLLKLDNLQPSGSFKIRGIGALCAEAARVFAAPAAQAEGSEGSLPGRRSLRNLTLVTSSGANAGMAVVHAAAQLGASSLVVLSESERGNNPLLPKFRRLGAQLMFVPGMWNDADEVARGLCTDPGSSSGTAGVAGGASAAAAAPAPAADSRGDGLACGEATQKKVYVPLFDHPSIFRGHATIVSELRREFEAAHGQQSQGADVGAGARPDAVVVTVGGGGLLSGVALGLIQAGWHRSVRVFAAQTEHCLSIIASLRAFEEAEQKHKGGGGGGGTRVAETTDPVASTAATRYPDASAALSWPHAAAGVASAGSSAAAAATAVAIAPEDELVPKPPELQAVPTPVFDADGHALGNRAACDTALQLWYNFRAYFRLLAVGAMVLVLSQRLLLLLWLLPLCVVLSKRLPLLIVPSSSALVRCAVQPLCYRFRTTGVWGNPIETVVVSDKDTLQMCARFADEHRINVEPLCAAGLAAVCVLLRLCWFGSPHSPTSHTNSSTPAARTPTRVARTS
jgi:threonine dehydratase